MHSLIALHIYLKHLNLGIEIVLISFNAKNVSLLKVWPMKSSKKKSKSGVDLQRREFWEMKICTGWGD